MAVTGHAVISEWRREAEIKGVCEVEAATSEEKVSRGSEYVMVSAKGASKKKQKQVWNVSAHVFLMFLLQFFKQIYLFCTR